MTTLSIHGTDFYLDGVPSYQGRTWQGHRIEGLLFNSRMIQGIFDDSCAETRGHWAYPDTGIWDPERNVSEFIAALPAYRRHGLLGVTVGLQGGGSIYTAGIYDQYHASAFADDGSLDPAWINRLDRVLAAADAQGMVVIVSYFYFRHARHLGDAAVRAGVVNATEHLMATGRKNLIIEICNESQLFKSMPLLRPDGVHAMIALAQEACARTIPVMASTVGGPSLPEPAWMRTEDLHAPHGNGLTPAQLTDKLARLKADPIYQANPKPILINEDSIIAANMDAAIACGASWGYYSQGMGSDYQDLTNWKQPREARCDDLSGYQTLPVNWGINTDEKRAFFQHVAAVTGADV
ncbi:MAG: hypothetical protein PF961_13055 [Planctomycetota bacterium]|jgi:hypothetical protein|nr:hypothetical protein [Planctomycetota bacterium]